MGGELACTHQPDSLFPVLCIACTGTAGQLLRQLLLLTSALLLSWTWCRRLAL